MKYLYPIMHVPNLQTICTNIKHTTIRSTHDVKTNRTHACSNTHLNTDVKSNQTHILYIYMKNYFYVSFMLNSASFRMSTYVRELRPPKIVSGSEDSWLSWRLSPLWGGGRKESGFKYTLSPSQRLCVYVSACARVSVCQCCTSAFFPQGTTT